MKTTLDLLAKKSAQVAMVSAVQWLRNNNLEKKVDLDQLVVELRNESRLAIDEALDDVKMAYEAGMSMVAEKTFTSSMSLAGIRAAKKVSEHLLVKGE